MRGAPRLPQVLRAEAQGKFLRGHATGATRCARAARRAKTSPASARTNGATSAMRSVSAPPARRPRQR
eukprot:43552-Heterocapsa_arctica.AAC.1